MTKTKKKADSEDYRNYVSMEKDDTSRRIRGCPYQALHDYAIIRTTPRKLKGNIVLPEGVKMEDRVALVVSVGPKLPIEYLGMYVIFAHLRAYQDLPNPEDEVHPYMLVPGDIIAVEIIDENLKDTYRYGLRKVERTSGIEKASKIVPASGKVPRN